MNVAATFNPNEGYSLLKGFPVPRLPRREFPEPGQLVALPGLNRSGLTSFDEQDRYTIMSDVDNFKRWLEKEGYFSNPKTGGDEYLASHQSKIWSQFMSFLEDAGYLPIGAALAKNTYPLLPQNQKLYVKKSDSNFDHKIPALNQRKSSDYNARSNLFDLFQQYLNDIVKVRNISKNSFYGHFLANLNHICKQGGTSMFSNSEKIFEVPRYQGMNAEQLRSIRSDAIKDEHDYASIVDELMGDGQDYEEDELPSFLYRPREEFKWPTRTQHILGSVSELATTGLVSGAVSMGTTMLMTTASRAAIVAVLSSVGIGAIPAGVAAGIAIGAYRTWDKYQTSGSKTQRNIGYATTIAGAFAGAFGAEPLLDLYDQYVSDHTDKLVGVFSENAKAVVNGFSSFGDVAVNSTKNLAAMASSISFPDIIPSMPEAPSFEGVRSFMSDTMDGAKEKFSSMRSGLSSLWSGASEKIAAATEYLQKSGADIMQTAAPAETVIPVTVVSPNEIGSSAVQTVPVSIPAELSEDVANYRIGESFDNSRFGVAADTVDTLPGLGDHIVNTWDMAAMDAPAPATGAWEALGVEPPVMASVEMPVNAYIGDLSLSDSMNDVSASDQMAALSDVPAFEEYTVARGDNLYNIVKDEYGLNGAERHEAVKKIIAANPEIASRPDELKLGQTLKLPTDLAEAPTADCNEYRLRKGYSQACTVPSIS